jgi:competence protein ComEC
MRTPAAIAAIPLLTGAALGLSLSEQLPGSFAFCAAAAALIALLAAAGSIGFDLVQESTLSLTIGLLFAGSSLGATAAAQTYHPPLLAWFESRRDPVQVVLDGVLREDASVTPFGSSVTLDVVRIDDGRLTAKPGVLGGVRLTVTGSLAASQSVQWRAGRLLRLTAMLRKPATYLDPGVRDERRALARRGVILVGSVKSAALVEVLALGSMSSEAAGSIRAWTRATLTAAIGPWRPRSAAIAAAILIGDRTGLSEEDSRRLQEAGTYHVIAISGGNIAILTVLLLALTRAARLPPALAAATATVALLFYRLITTSASSVDRAITAAIVYLLARPMDLPAVALNVLGAAAVLGVAASPITLFDPGFILSFGATLAILVSMSLMARRARPQALLRRLARGAGALLVTSVATEVALLPASALFFSRVTFAGLLLNFVAIPLMAVLQIAALAVLVAQPLQYVPVVCAFAAHVAAEGLLESARFVEYAPWLSRDVVTPTWWVMSAYYAALIAALPLGRRLNITARQRPLTGRRARLAAATGCSFSAVLILLGPGWVASARAPAGHAPLRVVFLDVGQGDATVILLPGGRALLVDAGGIPAAAPSPDPTADNAPAFDIGERVVGPALRTFGVRRLDALVITHGDPDHIGGAMSVMRAFRPRAVWEGVPVPPHAGLRALVTIADATATGWRTLQTNDRERFGPVEICVLHPPRPDWERQRVRNEDSVVLDLRIGDVSIILPGDIGREGERAVIPLLRRSRVVVLKAPHHGSATSSTQELLNALRPSVVVFSAGRANRFGHPHPTVVQRYRALGAQIFSTAEDGAVILDTDGKSVEVRGWTGRTSVFSAIY